MANCPKCQAEMLSLLRLGNQAVLACAICRLTVSGTVEWGHLVPHQDNMPILPLTGGAVHVLDPVG